MWKSAEPLPGYHLGHLDCVIIQYFMIMTIKPCLRLLEPIYSELWFVEQSHAGHVPAALLWVGQDYNRCPHLPWCCVKPGNNNWTWVMEVAHGFFNSNFLIPSFPGIISSLKYSVVHGTAHLLHVCLCMMSLYVHQKRKLKHVWGNSGMLPTRATV